MKKLVALLLSIILAVSCFASFTAFADDEPEAYLMLKGTADSSPLITFCFQEEFDIDSVYTFYALAKFSDDCDAWGGGCAYVNAYAYSDVDCAMHGDWTALNGFIDFAKYSGSEAKGSWEYYSFSFNPSKHDYGGSGELVQCKAIDMGIGFWQATGTIYVAELGIMDDQGEVIFSKDFTYGLDLDDPDLATDPDHCLEIVSEDNKGDVWDVIGAKEIQDVDYDDETTAALKLVNFVGGMFDITEDPSFELVIANQNAKYQSDSEVEMSAIFDYKYDDENLYLLIGYVGEPIGTPDSNGNGNGTNYRIWFNTNDEATVYTHFIDIAYDGDDTPIISGKKNGSLTSNSGATAISTDGVQADSITIRTIEDTLYVVKAVIPFSVIEADDDFGFFLNVSNGKDDAKGIVNNAMIYPVGIADGLDETNPKNYFPYNAWNDAAIPVAVGADEPSVEPSSEPVNPPKPGDAGMITLAVVAVVALAGAVIVKKH